MKQLQLLFDKIIEQTSSLKNLTVGWLAVVKDVLIIRLSLVVPVTVSKLFYLRKLQCYQASI